MKAIRSRIEVGATAARTGWWLSVLPYHCAMGWYRIDTPGIFAGPSNPAVTAFCTLWDLLGRPRSARMLEMELSAGGATYFLFWPGIAPSALIEEFCGVPCNMPLASNLRLIFGE